jgi:hypothetical protein
MKKELQADAELDWDALLEWISGQAKLEMFNTTMILKTTTPLNRTMM